MQIVDYKYRYGTELREGYYAIPELNRKRPSINEFMKLMDLDVTLTHSTAVIHINGVSISSSDTSLTPVEIRNYVPVIKGTAGFQAHAWCGSFKNTQYIQHVESISGTCAAGIEAIYKAKKLLKKVDEVIIVGGERISPDTLRLFKELKIPLICGDGFVFMRLKNKWDGNHIRNTSWGWEYNPNPFVFESDALRSLIPIEKVDYIKLHGTGTEANTAAEARLAKIAKPLIYKDKIGHTQGISALVETCMVLDDPEIMGKILVTANGLGGYYGAFTLHKDHIND
jgi:hypothetical protein